MSSHEAPWCPVMRPSARDFQRPFVQYIEEVFADDPDLPMFKVIPPAGWRPRDSPFPDLDQVKIHTPIRQNVLGSKGAFRCVFVEEPEMSVAQFQEYADAAAQEDRALQRRAKAKGADDDSYCCQLERSFWSSITLNPPLYGADTPVSFFDPKLQEGWNLQDLGDLLSDPKVPEVPGVTTPMTYFGMWRSFFGWHKEDADLLSINYLHFGAPKMWYCISPQHRARFERLAAGLFPHLHKACRAFIRHKDIMLSPSLLHAHGIPFMQARHGEGEFIVLNAASYHAGFNMGFNCAEAVNFATPSWLQAGKEAERCTCRKDAVRLSMRLFDPEWSGSESSRDGSSSSSGEEEEEEERGGRQEGKGKAAGKAGPGPQLGGKRGAQAKAGAQAGPSKRGKVSGPGGEEVKVLGPPCATVGEDQHGAKFFHLMQRIDRPASSKDMVVLRWLKEGTDGLYRPSHKYWEETAGSLIPVRMQFMPEGIRTSAASSATPPQQQLGAGWKLLTLKSKILDTDLV